MDQTPDGIRASIKARYANVARSPGCESSFPVGPASAKTLGYAPEEIDRLPLSATESFAGVGNPFSLGVPQVGDTVLDLGCGAGLDTILAARMVGPSGKVIGVDLTPEMVDKAAAKTDQLPPHMVRDYGITTYSLGTNLVYRKDKFPNGAPRLLGRFGRTRHADDIQQPAGIRAHEENAVAEINGFFDRVRDEKHRALLFVPQLNQQFLHSQSNARIKRAEGFVHQENFRFENQRRGNGDE